jgi:hypothetical protein
MSRQKLVTEVIEVVKHSLTCTGRIQTHHTSHLPNAARCGKQLEMGGIASERKGERLEVWKLHPGK